MQVLLGQDTFVVRLHYAWCENSSTHWLTHQHVLHLFIAHTIDFLHTCVFEVPVFTDLIRVALALVLFVADVILL